MKILLQFVAAFVLNERERLLHLPFAAELLSVYTSLYATVKFEYRPLERLQRRGLWQGGDSRHPQRLLHCSAS
jgi:hypothetical protein